MTLIDALILSIFLGGLIVGLLMGMVKISLLILSPIAGFIISSYLYQPLAGSFEFISSNSSVQKLVAFITIFLAVFVIIAIAGWLIVKLLKKLHLNWFNRMAGGLIGLAVAFIFSGSILMALTAFELPSNKYLSESKLATLIYSATDYAITVAPGEFKEFYRRNRDEIEKLKKYPKKVEEYFKDGRGKKEKK